MEDSVAHRPLIWVLKGLRAGDTAQAMQLALQLGGRVEGKQLAFNARHLVPNWLLGSRVSHLTKDARSLLRPPWPDMVVATGKRTAPVALWIKQQSEGRTRIVQLGRPRMALKGFDLVVTTPQYGLPHGDNVVEMPLPFAGPKSVPHADIASFNMTWTLLPRPWILAVVGGGKFPVRLNAGDLTGFGKALQHRAAQTAGSIILLDSPRSPTGAVDSVAAMIDAPKWIFHRGGNTNPYQPALALCDELVVTSDSVSMVTEMLLTGKPASLYRLSVSRLLPRWSAKSGFGAMLARAGILHPPRDVDGLMARLIDDGHVGDLAREVTVHKQLAIEATHQAVVERIKTLLNA
jgi:uncharacterized protein